MKKTLYIVLAALMVAISALWLQRPSDHKKAIEKQIAGFELSLKKLDALNKKVFENAESSFMGEGETADRNNIWKTAWEKDRTAVLLYSNGKLNRWNTNDVPFRFQLDGRQKNLKGFLRLANGLYLTRSKMLDENRQLVVFTLIRNEYPIHNRYLKDDWHPDLKNTSDLVPYLYKQEGSKQILLTTGAELFVSITTVSKSVLMWSSASAWLLFFALMIWALYRFRNQIDEDRIILRSLIIFSGLIVLRAIMLMAKWPGPWYSLPIFDPIHHASNTLIPSLGDLLLNSLVTLAIIREMVGKPTKTEFESDRRESWMTSIMATIFMLVLVFPVAYVFRLLIINSSFSLDLTNPFNLDQFSLAALVTTSILMFSIHLVHERLARVISQTLPSVIKRVMVVLITAGISILICKVAFPHLFWPMLAGSIVVVFQVVSYKWQHRNKGFSTFTSNVLVYALPASILLIHYQGNNEVEERKTIARKVFSDEDPVAEFLFDDWREEVTTDRKIKGMISVLPAHSEDLVAALEQKLQFDPWSKYVATIHVFDGHGELIAHNAGQDLRGLPDLVNRISNSRPTHSDGLYYKGIVNGNGGYLSRILFRNPRSNELLADVFIDLQPQLGDHRIGFPELLLDSRFSQHDLLRNYSYARYVDGELIDRSGDYPFSLVAHSFGNISSEFSLKNIDEHSHLVYRPVDGILIILTRAKGDTILYFTVFSYLFLLYFVVGGLSLFIRGSVGVSVFQDHSFRNRINFAMISIITFTLILVGLGTVMYVVEEYRTKNRDLISEKSRSVQIEMEHKLRSRETLEPADHDELSMLLNKFSKVFFTDINLYDLNGNLLATSRPKVFEEGLISSRMDPTAFFEMKENYRSEFIHDEYIGKLEFLAAYTPFRNEKRELMAYLSLPYFARQNELRQEVVSLLAALINIYVLLILLAVVVALFISNRITEPLRIIRENLRTLKLDKHNQSIDWQSNDEIGDLVKEYNRTLSELVRNAELLARSERESAWREMAKQVAHEIKNPLTPMKLTIQMLERSYHDGADDLGERIERTAKTLVEQIDTLSDIATEFSSFAQMPVAEIERVELLELLRSCAELHAQTEGSIISFKPEIEGLVWINADQKQMLRVLNNLVRNAIQAIPDNQEGRIDISLKREGESLLVSVSDNGAGIPMDVQDKIFVPNFTTKSSGMGLGLAMVKNIVENMGGDIWFDTKEGIGTQFYVRLVEQVAS